MKYINVEQDVRVKVSVDQAESWAEVNDLQRQYDEDYLVEVFNRGWALQQVDEAVLGA